MAAIPGGLKTACWALPLLFALAQPAWAQCRGIWTKVCPPDSGGGAVYTPSLPQGPTPEELRQNEARQVYAQATALWDDASVAEKDWDRIIALIGQALALWPDNAHFAENLRIAQSNRASEQRHAAYRGAFDAGRQAASEDRWGDAARHYQAALTYRPDDSAARNNLNRALGMLAQIRAAPEVARAATRLLQDILADPIGEHPDARAGMRQFADLETVLRARAVVDDTALSHKERINAALSILAAPWFISNPILADRYQREIYLAHARSELTDMFKQTLSSAIGLMAEDIRRLEPFRWNPLGGEQRAVIASMEGELRTTVDTATGEIAEGPRLRLESDARGDRLVHQATPAMRQLDRLNRMIRWEGQ